MQYVIYFAVTAPLVLAGLLWASANTPPPPPMFNSGYNALTAKAYDPAQAIQKAAADKAAAKKAVADNTAKTTNPAAADKKG